MCCKLFRDLVILGLVPVCHPLCICSLEQECTDFAKIWEPSQNSRHQKGDINYGPCWSLRDIRWHDIKFNHLGSLGPRNCAHLPLSTLLCIRSRQCVLKVATTLNESMQGCKQYGTFGAKGNMQPTCIVQLMCTESCKDDAKNMQNDCSQLNSQLLQSRPCL